MKGMEVVKKMELVGTSNGKPTSNVKIIDCGEVSQIKAQDAAQKDKGKSKKKKSSKDFPSGVISDREARGTRRKDSKEKRIKRKRSYSSSSDSYSQVPSQTDSESETNPSSSESSSSSDGKRRKRRSIKRHKGRRRERKTKGLNERKKARGDRPPQRRNKDSSSYTDSSNSDDERVGHDKAKKSKKAKDGGKLSTAVHVGNAADSSPAEKNFSREEPDSFLNNDELVGNGKASKVDNQRADSVKSRSMSPVPRRNQNTKSKSPSRSPLRDLGNRSRSPREKLIGNS